MAGYLYEHLYQKVLLRFTKQFLNFCCVVICCLYVPWTHTFKTNLEYMQSIESVQTIYLIGIKIR